MKKGELSLPGQKSPRGEGLGFKGIQVLGVKAESFKGKPGGDKSNFGIKKKKNRQKKQNAQGCLGTRRDWKKKKMHIFSAKPKNRGGAKKQGPGQGKKKNRLGKKEDHNARSWWALKGM